MYKLFIYNSAMLGEHPIFTAIKTNVFFFYIVVCCMTYVYICEGRTVQGIKGRNVSLSWTFDNIKKDAILILHGSTPFVRVWLTNNHFIPHKNDERLQFNGEVITDNAVTFTINIMNVTEADAGHYKVERQWDSKEFNDSVFLEIIDERLIPRITMVRHNISDSSIVLQCGSSGADIDVIIWKLNGSLIGNYNRHSLKNTCISISNLTANDGYSLYTCEQFDKRISSEPYRLVYGPNEIFVNTSDNAIQVHEFDIISILCSADCFPPCQIVWNVPNTETTILGSELKLHNLNMDINYTCHAINPLKSNAMIFTAIYIKMKSGAHTDKTIKVNAVMDSGNNSHFLYALLGVGILLAVGLLGCLLHRLGACSRVNRTLNRDSMTHSINLEEVNLSGHYWTIVSNASGDLRTAIETNIGHHQTPIPECTRNFLKPAQTKPSLGIIDVNGVMGLEDYMDPIQSHSMDHVDYIHPVHCLVDINSVQKNRTI